WALTLNESGSIPRLISVRSESSEGGVIITELNNWEASILSDVAFGIPDSNVSFASANALVFDQKHNRYLLSDYENDAVVAVDASTGKRTIFSSDSIGYGDPYGLNEGDRIKTLALDAPRNRLIVSELTTGNIFAVNLDTAERVKISEMT